MDTMIFAVVLAPVFTIILDALEIQLPDFLVSRAMSVVVILNTLVAIVTVVAFAIFGSSLVFLAMPASGAFSAELLAQHTKAKKRHKPIRQP